MSRRVEKPSIFTQLEEMVDTHDFYLLTEAEKAMILLGREPLGLCNFELVSLFRLKNFSPIKRIVMLVPIGDGDLIFLDITPELEL